MSLEKIKAYLKKEIMSAAGKDLFADGELTEKEALERFELIRQANKGSLEELVQAHMEAKEACHQAHEAEQNIKGALMFRSAGFTREETEAMYDELEGIALKQIRAQGDLKERVGSRPA